MAQKRALDKEYIISCGVIAVLAAISCIFLGLLFLGVDLLDCNQAHLIEAFTVLSGGFWGILLCRNC